jgi:hypothetical protein
MMTFYRRLLMEKRTAPLRPARRLEEFSYIPLQGSGEESGSMQLFKEVQKESVGPTTEISQSVQKLPNIRLKLTAPEKQIQRHIKDHILTPYVEDTREKLKKKKNNNGTN